MLMNGMLVVAVVAAVVAIAVLAVVVKSFVVVAPGEIGLVAKTIGRTLDSNSPIAFDGEAGYQAALLMPGLRFKLWPVYKVSKHSWVQVPAGGVGVVVSQIGAPLPIGAKSARYDAAFGDFTDLRAFLDGGGCKGVQRHLLAPGALLPIHPAAFLVITEQSVFGVAVSPEFSQLPVLSPQVFGLRPEQLRLTVIGPDASTGADRVGVITAFEGDPLPVGEIANRLGGFADVAAMEADDASTDAQVIETILAGKNDAHNNYQDVQAFIDAGGRIGLQHDVLLPGAYLLHPMLFSVELVPMVRVRQGEVAVVKSNVGLPTVDMSGAEFKFGSIVRPGHRGLWREPLRTGKYALNPRCYVTEIVPTNILTLNWSTMTSEAHKLDARLSPIDAKSKEGFVFRLDLQVQIHVPDTKAPKVISMVGTMENLVNEVLQSAVGNYFRNAIQAKAAIQFIEERQDVQDQAQAHVVSYLGRYEVETRGVYIQDVILPAELVEVLTEREIANQSKQTFLQQQEAQLVRVDLEKTRGTADMQAQLATAQVSVEIERASAAAREQSAIGEASFVRLTGDAEAAKIAAIGAAEAGAVEAMGLAKAKGYEAQVDALGSDSTAAIAVASALADGRVAIVPDVLVSAGGGAIEGLAATLIGRMQTPSSAAGPVLPPPAPSDKS